jgi:hypothetical protein
MGRTIAPLKRGILANENGLELLLRRGAVRIVGLGMPSEKLRKIYCGSVWASDGQI